MTSNPPVYRVWIGWDPDEVMAYNVAQLSLRSHASIAIPIDRLALLHLQAQGLYRRPTRMHGDYLWDDVSDAPMSTQHAITRFFVPMLSQYEGWAVFVDGDVLFRQDIVALFAQADPQYAVQVVQHRPGVGGASYDTKKNGMPQLPYPRKNWSSVMLFNCAHPSHRKLTVALLNTRPGRDLHRFCWLKDEEIGTLAPEWNHLVNVSDLDDPDRVALAHFTLGTPNLPHVAPSVFDGEWRQVRAAAGYRALSA